MRSSSNPTAMAVASFAPLLPSARNPPGAVPPLTATGHPSSSLRVVAALQPLAHGVASAAFFSVSAMASMGQQFARKSLINASQQP